MSIQEQKLNRFQNGGKLKSQRLINILLEAKRKNPDITQNELYYMAMGWKVGQR